MPRSYHSRPHRDFTLRLDPVLHKVIQLHAVNLGVPASQIMRDVLALWTGYATPIDDPRFKAEYIGGDLPGIEERFPGYVDQIDFFRKASGL